MKSLKLSFKLLVSCSVLIFSACATQPNAIMKQYKLGENVSLATDSRLRIITNVGFKESESRPGRIFPQRIICSEPSPDVAVALANSFGFGVSIMGQGSASLSASQAEGLLQLTERTSAIQALRDQMFRACEAYANGAITGTTYNLTMTAMNDTMVTLLLAETAGGAFGRSLGALGGSASSKASASMEGLSQSAGNLNKTASELDKAEKEVEQKQEIYNAKQDIAKKDGASEDEIKAAKEAELELDAAKKKRNELLALLREKAKTMSEASAEIKSVTSAGEISHTPSAEVAESIGSMQKAFLDKDFYHDVIKTCLVELGNSEPFIDKEKKVTGGKSKPTSALKSLFESLATTSLAKGKDKAKGQKASEELGLKSVEYLQKLPITALSSFCDEQLGAYITNAGKNQSDIKKLTDNNKKEIEIKKAEKEVAIKNVEKEIETIKATKEVTIKNVEKEIEVEKSKQSVAKMKTEEAQTKKVVELDKAIKHCGTIKNDDERKLCLSIIASAK